MNFTDIYFIDLLAKLYSLSLVLCTVGSFMVFLFTTIFDFDNSFKFILYIGIVLVIIGATGIFLSPSQEFIEILRETYQ